MQYSASAQGFALHDGDRVVFYGDSITAQHLYTRYVEEAVRTRYPSLRVDFINAGVPGETVFGGYAGKTSERVARDVAPFHPTMIAVMLGMNDGGYAPYSDKTGETFRSGYMQLIAALRLAAPEARLTLILPSPYDERTHGSEFPGYSATVQRLGSDVRAIASELAPQMPGKVFVADFQTAVSTALTSAAEKVPAEASWMIPDRIHPGEAVHWMMAAELLQAWRFDPLVSSVHLRGPAVVSQEKAVVTGLQRTATGLTWKQLDDALPLPLSPGEPVTELLRRTYNIEVLDRQILRVDELAPGSYDLVIDGKQVTRYALEDLVSGVNLALVRTPMLNQARGSDWWEQRRAILDQAQFILTAETKANDDHAAALRALQRGKDELAVSATAKLKPVAHSFELVRR